MTHMSDSRARLARYFVDYFIFYIKQIYTSMFVVNDRSLTSLMFLLLFVPNFYHRYKFILCE